jgi:hypothetical protein
MRLLGNGKQGRRTRAREMGGGGKGKGKGRGGRGGGTIKTTPRKCQEWGHWGGNVGRP